MKRKITSKLNNHFPINASLLIPEKYSRFVTSGTLRLHLKQLLTNYLIVIQKGMCKNSRSITISYQEPDQNLIKKSFKPFPEDWAVLKTLAAAHGTSMTNLFTFLLKLEIWEKEYDVLQQNSKTHTPSSNQKPAKVGVPTLVGLNLECRFIFRGQVKKFEKVFELLRN